MEIKGGGNVEADRKEILRYLGYGKKEADERINILIDDCMLEVQKAASPKVITRVFPLKYQQKIS